MPQASFVGNSCSVCWRLHMIQVRVVLGGDQNPYHRRNRQSVSISEFTRQFHVMRPVSVSLPVDPCGFRPSGCPCRYPAPFLLSRHGSVKGGERSHVAETLAASGGPVRHREPCWPERQSGVLLTNLELHIMLSPLYSGFLPHSCCFDGLERWCRRIFQPCIVSRLPKANIGSESETVLQSRS